MAPGDEVGFTEDLYQQLIGKYVVTIEVLMKRLSVKDQHITQLEAQEPRKSADTSEGC